MQKQVDRVIRYFAYFDYAPSFEQIYTFLDWQTTRSNLQKALDNLIKQNRLFEKDNLYTPREYLYKLKDQKKRLRISKAKIRKLRPFLRLILLFPQIKLVALSGSVAMMNAKKDDDIDFFVITAKNRLWTGRFIIILIASLFGRRKFNDPHTSDKLCLNLFFDEKNLKISMKKRTYYVAHEVLQMKPIIDKNSTYKCFIEANNWVFKLFPNARVLDTQFFDADESARFASLLSTGRKKLMSSHPSNILSWIGDRVEKSLKKFQLALISRHKTTETITDTQLWFFPQDFERKLQGR